MSYNPNLSAVLFSSVNLIQFSFASGAASSSLGSSLHNAMSSLVVGIGPPRWSCQSSGGSEPLLDSSADKRACRKLESVAVEAATGNRMVATDSGVGQRPATASQNRRETYSSRV